MRVTSVIKKRLFFWIIGILAFAMLALSAGPALAVPTLQLYIEGATYDAGTETWTTGSPNFTLWVLGDGSISNVKLAAAFSSSDAPTIVLTPTMANSTYFPGFVGTPDPSTPVAPTSGSSGVGTQPITGDGDPLPSHGIYGPGTSFQTFNLGNFTLTDSPIGDYTSGACPSGACSFPDMGQINAYGVSITGISAGGSVHFDTFDTVVRGQNHVSVFAPFSHDGETTPVPEPATLLLLGSGLAGLGFFGRKRLTKRDQDSA